MTRLPLEGIRIIDSTYVIAMPYACGILADLGAEVIKVEGPSHVDNTRSGMQGAYADNDAGNEWWNRASTYNMLHRGKRSLTLDLSRDEGRDVFKELIAVSDVLVENYTPRVMRRWGLDYPNLKKIKPDIIMVSNTGYGHGEGPYSSYPAMATSLEGTHGQVSITGYPGELPSKAGQSYVDFLASWVALLGIGMALHHRNRTGNGQWMDLGMYQVGSQGVGEYVMDWIANGRLPERIGDRHPWRAPQGCYPCSGDDQWCVISVGDEEEWAALCGMMGKPELASELRFATASGRMEHHTEIDEMVRRWTVGVSKWDVMERLQGAGVPAGPVNDARDSNLSPHYWERGFLEKIVFPPDRKMGTRVVIGRPWQLDKTPITARGPAPRLGEDNESVLGYLLGLDESELEELEESGVVSEVPINARAPEVVGLQDQVDRGRLAYFDPDYKAKLGI